MAEVHQTDVVVVGAGPSGLFTVFECGMMKLKCHVIDSLDMVGGQCSALYPEKPIYDIPGFPKIDAQALIDNLKSQANPFSPTYHLGQQVMEVNAMPSGGWRIVTSNDTKIDAKVVIIAGGVGSFGPNRPPLQGIEEYEGKSVQYYVKAREDFRGKRIVIAGGGDSAVDWAVSLSEVAEHVTVVHRRPKFRAAPDMVDKLTELSNTDKLDLAVPYQLTGLEGQNGILSAVIVENLDGEKKSIEADCLLPFYGLAMELGPINNWGLELDHGHIKVDPSTMETNIPGIFAVGDIASYPNKLKLILTGFAEAAQAAHKARDIVYPDQVHHFEYSTTSGVAAL